VEVRISESPNRILVALEGDLVGEACGRVRDETLKRLRAKEKRCESVWVDLRRVTLIDSIGLGVLMGLKATSRQHRARLILVEPSRAAQSALDAVGFADLFDIVGLKEAACQAPDLFAR